VLAILNNPHNSLILSPVRRAICMNAITYYSELTRWLLSHANDTDMSLLQSIVTCGALFWSVKAPPNT
jgi:hypothetical protein